MTRRAKSTLFAGFAMAIALPALAIPAQAGDPSVVVATPGVADVTILVPASISAALDDACANALSTGKTYSINADIANTAVATVSPAQSGAVQCPTDNGKAGGKTLAKSATFTVSAASAVCSPTKDGNASTTMMLAAIVGPPGQQNKIGDPTPVPVNVTGAPDCGTGTGTETGSGANPAAPAVANTYLNADNGGALTAACKAKYGKSWRGSVISSVAAAMPKPESQKDLVSFTEWTTTWRTFVDNYCAPTP